MVAVFSSYKNMGDPNNFSDTYNLLEYGNKGFSEWLYLGVQGPRIEVAKKADTGIIMPKDCDISYFSSDFGNAVNSVVEVSLNKVGVHFSKAYNVRASIDKFMNTHFDPNVVHPGLDCIYDRLKSFAKEKGYESAFEINNFTSGFLPDSAVAAVLPIAPDYGFFFKNKAFSEWIGEIAKQYKVNYESAELYIMMHEFTHLFGVNKGDPAEYEAKLEELINDFADSMIKDISSASNISDARRTELARTLRQIKKIAASRYQNVHENYGSSMSMKTKSMSQSTLESVISELINEAAEQNMTEQGVKEYVEKHIGERIEKYSDNKGEYKGRNETKEKENKGDKKEERTEEKESDEKAAAEEGNDDKSSDSSAGSD